MVIFTRKNLLSPFFSSKIVDCTNENRNKIVLHLSDMDDLKFVLNLLNIYKIILIKYLKNKKYFNSIGYILNNTEMKQ